MGSARTSAQLVAAPGKECTTQEPTLIRSALTSPLMAGAHTTVRPPENQASACSIVPLAQIKLVCMSQLMANACTSELHATDTRKDDHMVVSEVTGSWRSANVRLDAPHPPTQDDKEMWKYDIVKNAVIGAAIGAMATFIIPFMKPTKGAFLGALVLVGIGIYKNLSNKSSAITMDDNSHSAAQNISEEIERYHKLHKDGALSESEFEEQKRKLLNK